jgi:hypothetical protein
VRESFELLEKGFGGHAARIHSDAWRPVASTPVVPASRTGALTVICMPKCDQIIDNNVPLGPGHIFNRPVTAGRHVLELSAPNGSKKRLVVDVDANQTKEVRMAMDGVASTRLHRRIDPRDRF